ncbi:bifunctional folylpolyglutamate synthase/dihydrofolate synthase [Prevotella histicola]|uniref:bifunctional folylpolyglutamate synthase/dihydrofolate synthase n=1 Tax=Prevotella histicola TaxID=470565 RepID=UPI001C5E6739|nr:folylpolyglutamate synthase/dihydrofolate synthase family protein [Prevotella histicola]MBW4775997.1 bifunctional folylpolyglutamate synthase/dihydrofolate synthase [Prevotella histicola]
MNYQETIEYLYNSAPVFEHIGASAYKEGLENTLTLDEHFNHPHTHFLSIHIAGTNGKGSCSHSLAAILQAEGYKVGLYTSPHLVDFRERIKVNGKMIPEQYVIDFVRNERSFFEPLHPSFFELTTALAFKYFAEQKVDIAIIEVGLGGRLDCTNIITPILSIITNISFDHTQFLGNSLAEIAGEKAGIIKQGVPTIIGEAVPETRVVFQSKAQKMDSVITFAEDIPALLSSHILPNGGIKYQTRFFGDIEGELGGTYQEKNTNTVLTAAMYLYNKGIIKDVTSISLGLSKVCETTGLMGRWQKLKEHPLVICDTGHNAGGWKYLSQQIKQQPCKHRRIIFGMVDDKDLHTVIRMLPKEATFYWTQPSTKRAFPVKKIAEEAKEYGLDGNCYETVKDAYMTALKDAGEEDFIFVGGSSYIVADLLSKKI